MNGWDISHEYMQAMEHIRQLPWQYLLKDVSNREFAFLNIIYHFQMQNPDVTGIYASDLAEKLCITKSAVSKMLQHLEQRGLIERMVDRNSRRNTFVFLTPQGKELCVVQHKRWHDFMHRVAADLGTEHVHAILAGVREMTDVMRLQLLRTKEDDI